jgi:hypothetical protein
MPVVKSHWCRRGIGKARPVEPGSQETTANRKPTSPRGKGWHLMHRNTVLALIGAIILAVAVPVAAVAASAGPAVHVRISSTSKTLRNVTVRGETGWITKGGTPRGVCSGKSAAGALSAATHGRWTGKYYASLKDVFVTSILGVKPTASHYWGFFINGKTASKGVCETKLRAGERLGFKIVK